MQLDKYLGQSDILAYRMKQLYTNMSMWSQRDMCHQRDINIDFLD